MPYFHRSLEPILLKALQQFPAALITGPRQAGKSTLLKHCLKHFHYVTFDDPAERNLALQDPELFLSTHHAPLILDEIQYVPSLLPYLKMRIDARRSQYGQYVLTGSQAFELMEGISETLAGRIAVFQLYPFNWEEIPGYKKKAYEELKLSEQIVKGFYPEFFSNPSVDWNIWHSSYVSTYLERDVRNLKAINDLSRFQTFLSLIAMRAGSLLNLSEVAKECGISQPTAKDWMSILQATYIVYLLYPYYKNKTKRLIKSPKIYFVDTGLLSYLLGIDGPDRFLKASERGHIFENMVIMDFIKRSSNSLKRKDFYFYRTHSGEGIDLLIESGQELEAYEIKFTKTPTPKMASSLQKFMIEHPHVQGSLLCLRSTSLPLNWQISTRHWLVKSH